MLFGPLRDPLRFPFSSRTSLLTTWTVINKFTNFIDMIAPKWPRAIHKLARFFSRDHRNTHGHWAEYLFALHTCNHPVLGSCPERSLRSPFLSHPPPLSDGNLHPAALLRMRGNYFRPYLSILTCAIEVQHNNENSTTVKPDKD